MTPIQVVGIGLDGAEGLSSYSRRMVDQASILAGSDRHLSYFPSHPGERWPLIGLEERLRQHLSQPYPQRVAILTSGDPLFFGLGRQLLQTLPAETLTFHPHLSSIQLAFNRARLPWQEATLLSAHGRSLDRLEAALKKGDALIAVLTDNLNTPAAIARFVESLHLPILYRVWVCENLGGPGEKVEALSIEDVREMITSPLAVVILERLESAPAFSSLPLLGIPDSAFLSFRDRPGLMTKREVRVHILAELALQPAQTVWDIGAGTGSVSIEAARLLPHGTVWAIEKTTVGCELLQQNKIRFGTDNLTAVKGIAPAVLSELPAPHRIFVGGSSGQLTAILNACVHRLLPDGGIVMALATLENMAEVIQWLQDHADWQARHTQIASSRSVEVGPFTRWAPLNPVTLVRLWRRSRDVGQ